MKHTALIGTANTFMLNAIGWLYGTLADDRMGHFLSSLASIGSLCVAASTVTVLVVKYRRGGK